MVDEPDFDAKMNVARRNHHGHGSHDNQTAFVYSVLALASEGAGSVLGRASESPPPLSQLEKESQRLRNAFELRRVDRSTHRSNAPGIDAANVIHQGERSRLQSIPMIWIDARVQRTLELRPRKRHDRDDRKARQERLVAHDYCRTNARLLVA
jgi:hypothetical protein